MTDNVYVIDTSSLVDLRPYHSDVFVSLWENLEQLIANHRLVSHKMVFEDIRRRDDALFRWVEPRKRIFEDVDGYQVPVLQEIANVYPGWVNPQSLRNQSDPYVVALAVAKQRLSRSTLVQNPHIVITEESQDPNRLKIPSVCSNFGIRSVNLYGFFKEEGWRF